MPAATERFASLVNFSTSQQSVRALPQEWAANSYSFEDIREFTR